MDYDLKVVGGELFDGSGAPGRKGDVGVKDGKIVALGEAPGKAAETIDARGQAVAPGFIDSHTHYDAQVMWDRMLTISPWHGVTSVVLGNCGFGVAPAAPVNRDFILHTLEESEGMSFNALKAGFGAEWPFQSFPEYLDAIARRGVGINVAAYICHTNVRIHVMGEDAIERDATESEIGRMRALVKEALEAGALGFSSSMNDNHLGYGGKPVASRLASPHEVSELALALKDVGRGVLQFSPGGNFFLREFEQLVRDTGRTLSWGSLMSGFRIAGLEYKEMLAESQRLCDAGIPVIPQVFARPLGNDFQLKQPPPMLLKLAPMQRIALADLETRKKFYADPAFREELRNARPPAGGVLDALRWDLVSISACPSAPELENRNLSEIARSRGQHPVDLMLDLSLQNDLEARFCMLMGNHDEHAVAELLNARHTVLGAGDAGAHLRYHCDSQQTTDLVGPWVREKKAFPLERAIWMLTGRQAEVYEISDRGRLAPGLAADLVIFDPAKVGSLPTRRIYDLPGGDDRLISESTGIGAVVVNGTIIRRGDEDQVSGGDSLPGRVLRGGRARA